MLTVVPPVASSRTSLPVALIAITAAFRSAAPVALLPLRPGLSITIVAFAATILRS